ncbi:NAD(P)/FAD-dependent oxidoreductase [Phenylobacterium sp.]|uniref:NAD(P)/FAD-dependent oxidoreductase n=1 Tax=Phenylobacterium sp. TaxID=1871053 RepID=UPI0027310E12|nr:NAD(P)/FAD-dependent oxidoreductase [Phenylobacterium sp.]MDP1875279.1 NAD(P)/FAD-dependent oxidoreductase [Phenylobacterium sp.]
MTAPPDLQTFEAVVIGAGPAGLTAATYLARFRRRVLVLDGGPSRAAWIPESHNTPGFPQGVRGADLLSRLRTQAQEFGAIIQAGRVEALEAIPTGFRLEAGGGRIEAATVLLATGVVDRLPGIPGLEAAIRSSLVRMCPICDAYEAIDSRIAILGDGPLAEREARFLRTYSQDVTVLQFGEATEESSPAVVSIGADDLKFDDQTIVLRRAGDVMARFDHLYLALGCAIQSDLAVSMGARQDETGSLLVDGHQMSSVEGLYAAGDVVRGLNQISVAAGEAAIAAAAMHNRLRGF